MAKDKEVKPVEEDTSRAHYIHAPVRAAQGPTHEGAEQPGEHPVDIIQEFVLPEFIRSEQPEGQGNDSFGGIGILIY